MDDLNDIKFAVANEDYEIVAFFGNEELAENFRKQLEPEGRLLKRDDDFYIDIHVETSSSFDVR